MMYMLSSNSWRGTLRVMGVMHGPLVLEALCLGSQLLLDAFMVTVIEFLMLHSTQVVSVLLWQNLAVMYRLHSAVVVILVNLAVGGSCHIFVLVGLDSLMLHGRRNTLMYRGVVVPGFRHEALDGIFGCFHLEGLIGIVEVCKKMKTWRVSDG